MRALKIITSPFRYFLIFFCCMVMSCDQKDCDFQAKRIIMNATSHELEIHLFAADIETESFMILANASDSSDFSCSLTFCTTARTTCHDPLWNYRDSAVVVFNNERYLSYCTESLDCQVNEKNILGLNVHAENESGFEMIEENVFLFEITQQDYDSAITLE